MGNLKRGRLHVHSENSLKDSANKVEDIAKKAKEIGLDAVALTDHGNITGWQSFAKACKKEEIKPILGVECYVVRDANLVGETNEKDEDILSERSTTRLHLILLGMDAIGRKAIQLIVTEGNEHIIRAGKNLYPCVDKNIVRKYVGVGSEGHGHVIGTSACIGGVLAGLAFQNDDFKKEYSSDFPSLQNQKVIRENLSSVSDEYNRLIKTRDELIPISKKTYAKRLKVAEKMPEGEERERTISAINAEKEETEKAIEDLKKVKSHISLLKSQMSQLRKNLISDEKYEYLKKRCDFLKDNCLSDEDLIKKMEAEAIEWRDIFGNGYFFIELQNHFSENEAKWMPELFEIAKRKNIPVTCANDEHLINREDAEKRAYLGAMRFANFKYYEPKPEDYELYFKNDAELGRAILQVAGKDGANLAFVGIHRIINMCDDCDDFISAEKHYPKYDQSWTDEESCAALEKKARDGIKDRYPEWTEELEKRLMYELSIIDSMGFQDYFLIVSWYINIGTKLGGMSQVHLEQFRKMLPGMTLEEAEEYIDLHCRECVGYTTGPGRGSGAGSIVCYLTGITAIDPIKYDLVFERFLNPERVSMPDIDADFANQIRDILIEVVRKKYGNDGVAGIMTRGTLGAKYAIQNVAKVYGSKQFDDHKAYLSLADSMSDLIPKVGGTLADSEKAIVNSFGGDEDAMEIFRIAKGLEGTYIQVGKHAAGVVISDNGNIREYTALMWDMDAKDWKTQLDKEEVEQNHLLKMDFLGLKYLDIITETMRMVYEQRGVRISPNELEVEKDVLRIFADAETDSIFQFESSGMKDMLRKFRPSRFEDLVLLVAAYRPGPMQFLPEVFKVKNGAAPHYLTPELEPILKDTYGQIIYQEQVMKIFQDLAGYSLGGADLVRRAMGHKEADILLRERQAFIFGDESRNIKGCVNNGIDENAAGMLFSQMEAFASYAFNKSHAAAYAWISYITAYLKVKYTTEFMAVIIRYNGNSDETKGVKKIGSIVRDCKKHGIEVKCPDINISSEHPVVYNGKIYLGFSTIKGVVADASKIIEERNKNGIFTGIENVLSRCDIKKSAFRALGCAGAFDSFCSRKSIARNAEILFENTKDIREAREELALKQKIWDLVNTGDVEKATALNDGKKPVMKVLQKKIALLQKKISDLESDVRNMMVCSPGDWNDLETLNLEKEAIGVYISGSPLDSYKPVAEYYGSRLYDLRPRKGRVKLLIYAMDLERKKSKKNGTEFVSFTAQTLLGDLHAFCFDEDTMDYIQEANTPVIVEGFLRADRKNDDDDSGSDDRSVLTVESAAPAEAKYVFLAGELLTSDAMEKLKKNSAKKCVQNVEKPYLVVYCTVSGQDELLPVNISISEALRGWLEDNSYAWFYEI